MTFSAPPLRTEVAEALTSQTREVSFVAESAG